MKSEMYLKVKKIMIWMVAIFFTLFLVLLVNGLFLINKSHNESAPVSAEDPTDKYVIRMLDRSADTKEQITYFLEEFLDENKDMEKVDKILSKIIMYSTAGLPSPPPEFEDSHLEYEEQMEILKFATHDLKKAFVYDNQENGLAAFEKIIKAQDYLQEHFETVMLPYTEEEGT